VIGSNLIVDDVGHHLFLVGVPAGPVADHVHRRRDQAVDVRLRAVGGRQRVAGELVNDELVVGQVPIERVDHPVAVAPSFADVAGADGIALDAAEVEGVGVADDVEPVPPPPLAVMGAGQQVIDDLGERIR
jgi:hypothetical protein